MTILPYRNYTIFFFKINFNPLKLTIPFDILKHHPYASFQKMVKEIDDICSYFAINKVCYGLISSSPR